MSKVDNSALPEVKSSNTYWTVILQGGFTYKINTTSFLLSFEEPLPSTKTVSGFKHSAGLTESGIWSRVRLLPARSRVNFLPRIGYTWLKDWVEIKNQSDQGSDSLNKDYNDNALLLGAEFDFVLFGVPGGDTRAVFSYFHSDYRDKANKYTLELRGTFFDTSEGKSSNSKPLWEYFGYLSLGVDYITRSSGREDWFIKLSLSFGN